MCLGWGKPVRPPADAGPTPHGQETEASPSSAKPGRSEQGKGEKKAMKIVITGANRGIGLEFCRQLTARGDEVVAACRAASTQLSALAAQGARIVEGVDVTVDKGRERLAQAVADEDIHMLVNNAGIMQPVTLAQMDGAACLRQFEVNALSPLLLTHRLLGNLADNGKIAIVTSRMGSIDDNDSGGAYGYRMSKAAANMAGRSLAWDLKGRGIAVALLHPGWVRTDMTDGNGLIDADESVRGLIGVMDRLDLENTGQFWHTNGEILPW